jgi:hypothetical protein
MCFTLQAEVHMKPAIQTKLLLHRHCLNCLYERGESASEDHSISIPK